MQAAEGERRFCCGRNRAGRRPDFAVDPGGVRGGDGDLLRLSGGRKGTKGRESIGEGTWRYSDGMRERLARLIPEEFGGGRRSFAPFRWSERRKGEEEYRRGNLALFGWDVGEAGAVDSGGIWREDGDFLCLSGDRKGAKGRESIGEGTWRYSDGMQERLARLTPEKFGGEKRFFGPFRWSERPKGEIWRYSNWARKRLA